MKDVYKIFGISRNATQDEIKKRYKILSKKHHPDRPGGNAQIMKDIVFAYQILSNPEVKNVYDLDLDAHKFGMEEAEAPVISGLLPSAGEPYSLKYKKNHFGFINEFREKPLDEVNVREYFNDFASEIYSLFVPEEDSRAFYSDIFAFIKGKEKAGVAYAKELSFYDKSISIELAVQLFAEFLEGDYLGSDLLKLQEYFNQQIDKIRKDKSRSLVEIDFYSGMVEIITMAGSHFEVKDELISSIIKITDYIKQLDIKGQDSLIYLLQNKYFRNLTLQALHLYWVSNNLSLNFDVFDKFNGEKEIQEKLNESRSNLSTIGDDENTIWLLRHLLLLKKFDKSFSKENCENWAAKHYRKAALGILNWIPCLSETSGREILVNALMQAGLLFQFASIKEKVPVIQMADEKLASQLFIDACIIAGEGYPNLQLYAFINILKYMASFKFAHDNFKEIIQAFQKKVLTIANIFPIIEFEQSNAALFLHENKSIHLLRDFLQKLVATVEYNKQHVEQVPLDHEYKKILYHAYEACLKNWYEDTYNPETEKLIRLQLMEILLANNNWTFADLEKNLNKPTVMIDRNPDGWMMPVRQIATDSDEDDIFSSIDGIEINRKTGEILFLMETESDGHKVNENVLTISDMQEMFEKGISGAIFSLDPVDPEMPFHPFNQMLLKPASIYKTQLLNTFLLTDYILKFLTGGQEVSGIYPYAGQSLASLTSHLPFGLKKIINDYHNAKKGTSLHRFWIEAEQIDVAEHGDTDLEKEGIQRISFGDIRMVVKKHLMARDLNGNLIDVGDEDEGWPWYILTLDQFKRFKTGNRTAITSDAMIFIAGIAEVYFFENKKLSKKFSLENFDEYAERINKLPRDKNGKVQKDRDNQLFIYKMCKHVFRQTKMPSRFTPEYIFAQEFTIYYNIFAAYFPEFSRLRELSKVVALIEIMDKERFINNKKIEKFTEIINDKEYWEERKQKLQQAKIKMQEKYDKDYAVAFNKQLRSIKEAFSSWKKEISLEVLLSRNLENLASIKEQLGNYNLNMQSPELDEICEQLYASSKAENERSLGRSLFPIEASQLRYRIYSDKGEVARNVSRARRENYEQQLYELFTNKLRGRNVSQLINKFINGDSEPLAEALAEYEYSRARQEIIAANFSWLSVGDFELALSGSDAVHRSITNNLVSDGLDRYGRQVANEIAKLDKIIATEKQELQDELLGCHKLEEDFVRIGLRKIEDREETDLEGICLWVPANIKHKVDGHVSHLVYGGVRVQPNLNMFKPGSREANGLKNATFTDHNHCMINTKYFVDVKAAQAATQAARKAPPASATPAYNARMNNPGGTVKPPSMAANVQPMKPRAAQTKPSASGSDSGVGVNQSVSSSSRQYADNKQADLRANRAEKDKGEASIPDYDLPFNPRSSAGAAQAWTIKARLKSAQLPTKGKIRFIPDIDYRASEPLLKGPNNGFYDRFGNEWVKGPSRTPGQPFEWDVQLSPLGEKKLGWASRDGQHLNISLDGHITHK